MWLDDVTGWATVSMVGVEYCTRSWLTILRRYFPIMGSTCLISFPSKGSDNVEKKSEKKLDWPDQTPSLPPYPQKNTQKRCGLTHPTTSETRPLNARRCPSIAATSGVSWFLLSSHCAHQFVSLPADTLDSQWRLCHYSGRKENWLLTAICNNPQCNPVRPKS